MDRLFLGFHIKLTLSLLVAALVSLSVIVPRVERNRLRSFEHTIGVALHVLAEQIEDEQATTPGRSPLLERATQRHHVPLVLVNRQQLNLLPDELARLDGGAAVAKLGWERTSILYLRIGHTDHVLRMGPLDTSHPLAQGRGLGIAVLVMVGLSFGIFLLVRPLRQRLASLSRAAESFGRGNLTVRAVDDSRDAIGILAADFNRMAAQIEHLIAAQRELLRMVSHELRTPLQRMHFAFEKVRSADDDNRLDGVARVERDLRELDTLIDELLTYVRLEQNAPLQREPFAPNELCEDVIAIQAELADELAVNANLCSDVAPPATGNVRLLRRALGNLIKNAIHHARTHVDVTVSRGAGLLHFDVEDDGPGVPSELRNKLFEPFARLDIERQRGPAGCGLGLAIVRRIAEQHHGTVTISDSRLGGAGFRFSIAEQSS